ncbi:unnamed protein product [Amoebophrya sp. A25]|nr:unnamed protein product [Amoebophrya sp. A25]|eukprot:GSA25T00001006001.1
MRKQSSITKPAGFARLTTPLTPARQEEIRDWPTVYHGTRLEKAVGILYDRIRVPGGPDCENERVGASWADGCSRRKERNIHDTPLRSRPFLSVRAYKNPWMWALDSGRLTVQNQPNKMYSTGNTLRKGKLDTSSTSGPEPSQQRGCGVSDLQQRRYSSDGIDVSRIGWEYKRTALGADCSESVRNERETGGQIC